ncbi:MAG TPA: class I tRNA ligase family protein, partial [Jatrophihabitantaceae bacterium]|nr:class I tRNA ligase family protein [Jatrophihabitantaceae bacterium]
MTSSVPRRELPSQYAPADIEGPLYEGWVARGYFTADPASDKPPFSLVIPPPNVTGSLHLGHALEQSMMDAITRRERMRGKDVLWLPGMDHASIAVQNLVERYLAETEGKGRFDYSREEFVAKAWEWKERYGGEILGQMRR